MTILKNFSKKGLLISGKAKSVDPFSKEDGIFLKVYFDTLEEIDVISLCKREELTLLNEIINDFYGGKVQHDLTTGKYTFSDIPARAIYYKGKPIAIASPQKNKWFGLEDKKLYSEEEIYNSILQKTMVEQFQKKKIPLWLLEYHGDAVAQFLDW